MPNLLKVRVSLKGRPVRTYTFNKKDVSIGRDPTSDIFLDNTGISREHARIERTPGGYLLEDLGSANGTFLNDQPVQKDYVGHEDVVRIGKFALWMGVESEQRGQDNTAHPSPNAFEGTTVLTPDQLLEMQKKARVQESAPARPRHPAGGPSGGRLVAVISAAFLIGLALGAGGAFFYLS